MERKVIWESLMEIAKELKLIREELEKMNNNKRKEEIKKNK